MQALQENLGSHGIAKADEERLEEHLLAKRSSPAGRLCSTLQQTSDRFWSAVCFMCRGRWLQDLAKASISSLIVVFMSVCG